VPLTNGVNVITLHAVDPAGNTATLTTAYTLDCSTDQTAPALSIIWPSDGACIAGGQFMVQAQVDDPTATVAATVVDAGNNTNTAPGLVDRDGTVWVKSVPLSAGANTLTLLATDAAGNTTSASLTVTRSPLTLTLDPVDASQLGQSSADVSGMVSDATLRVYVNGVQAGVNDDGTWTASGVPINSGITAVFSLAVYPAEVPGGGDGGDGGGDGGGGGGPVTSVTSVIVKPAAQPNDVPTDSSPLALQQAALLKPPVVRVVDFHETDSGRYIHFVYVTPGMADYVLGDWNGEVTWTEGAGGLLHSSGTTTEWYFYTWLTPLEFDTSTELPPDLAGASGVSPMPMQHLRGYVMYSGHDAYTTTTADPHVALKTGGELVPGRTNQYLVKLLVQDMGGNPVDPALVQVPGWTLTPSAADTNWNVLIVQAPAQATVMMTPVVSGFDNYQFTFQASQINPQVAVDANRDGNITFDATDQTMITKPYRFWVNNDQDFVSSVLGGNATSGSDETVPVSTPDYANNQIMTIRDLEDFARVNILPQDITNEIADGTLKIGLKWKNTTGSPAVKLFLNLSPRGGTEYLTDATIAQRFLSLVAPGYVAAGETYFIPTTFWRDTGINTTNNTGYIIFEGCSAGRGQLVLTINTPDGTELAEAGGVWLDLGDIKSMYQRATATPSDESFTPPCSQSSSSYYTNKVFDESVLGYTVDGAVAFQQPPDETAQCVVFIHGWNMTYDEYVAFSETMFKRLWWQGYKGRFCAFRWATLTSPFSFNDSEFRAWKYGLSLKQYVEASKSGLPGYSMNIVAHSMGNIVAGSALYRGLTIDNYVLLQAALAAGCYNATSDINSYSRFTTAEQNSPTPDQAVPSMGYRGYLANVTANLVNFYNPNDFALATGTLGGATHLPFLWWFDTNWEANEETYKPNGDYYYYPEQADISQSIYRYGSPYGFVSDPQESMSYVARPRSKAVGALTGVGGAIKDQVDLSASFGFGRQRDDHSAEFNRSIQGLNTFYAQLLLELSRRQ
jgi:hypothetical protein